MTRHARARLGALERAALGALAAALACRGATEEQTRLLPSAGVAEQGVPVRTSDLRAGGVALDVAARNPYEGDAQGLAAGRLLYSSMNCAGCHGPAGGGGMGPPLADTDWIYGDAPENVVQSVLQGRPNGMPAFGGKLPASEAWKLAAFVKTLSAGAEGSAGGSDSPAVGSRRGTMKAGEAR